MKKAAYNLNIGLSDYAITAYLTLLKNHPVNGSQLSRFSGIPRARIYDVLRTLNQKGFVAESSEGMYSPLPPEEMIRRLRRSHEADLAILEGILEEAGNSTTDDFIWTLRGYTHVMAKAQEMVDTASQEIYVRLFPAEGQVLNPCLKEAEIRGVAVKYISMQPILKNFSIQVEHPDHETLESTLGGRSFDLVVDRKEILAGLFLPGREDHSIINWGKNRWFVTAGRDSLRHDFFHYFLHKTYRLKQPLSDEEQRLYDIISKDI